MKIVNEIFFHWRPYYENIGILGQQGEGKTTKCKEILSEIPNIPRIIWSPQRPRELYDGYGDFVDRIELIQRGFFVWTGDFGRKTFLKLCNQIFFNLHDIIFVVDDCHEQCTKQMIPPEFEHLILSGRNRGISGIYLSPFPNRVHNSILGSCQIMFAHRFDLQTQIEWMAQNFFGDDAWILLQKDKRKHGCFDSENDIPILPKYSVLYRKNTETETQLKINQDESLKMEQKKEIHERNNNSSQRDSDMPRVSEEKKD